MNRGFRATVALLMVATPVAAWAETVTLHGTMAGMSEIPPNDSTATGVADATLDTVTRKLSWTISYAGLSGPAVAAHFHGPGEPGKNAGIVLPFASPISPITGSATLSELQVADALAGRWYANVHTPKHPGGEIRAQMVR